MTGPRSRDRAAGVPDELALCGVPYRRLAYMTLAGYIRPVRGTNPWQWTVEEIRVAQRIQSYLDAGVRMEAAAYAARHGGVLPGRRFVITEAPGKSPDNVTSLRKNAGE